MMWIRLPGLMSEGEQGRFSITTSYDAPAYDAVERVLLNIEC